MAFKLWWRLNNREYGIFLRQLSVKIVMVTHPSYTKRYYVTQWLLNRPFFDEYLCLVSRYVLVFLEFISNKKCSNCSHVSGQVLVEPQEMLVQCKNTSSPWN